MKEQVEILIFLWMRWRLNKNKVTVIKKPCKNLHGFFNYFG
jgi:hypothetical protein